MASRRAGKFTSDEKKLARNAINLSHKRLSRNVDVIGDFAPDDEKARRVVIFEAEAAEIEAEKASLPDDVLLEPEILHDKLGMVLPLDLARTLAAKGKGGPAGKGADLTATVRGSGQPVEGTETILYLRSSRGYTSSQQAVTDANGKASFKYSKFWDPSALLLLPTGDFWSYVVRGPQEPATDVDLPALPFDGPISWWHRKLGVTSFDPDRGGGVRVGVCDTGAGPNDALSHVKNVGAFIKGAHLDSPDDGADVDSHGSHVSGTIGARPQKEGGYAGLAPGVELLSARVFPPDQGANQGDIANAIDYLSSVEGVDLINLSLGSPTGSLIEQDAILDALERGTLCICAAGNDGREPILYPAGFPETVSVSALGLEGWGPPGSLASLRYPEAPEKYGAENLFLASFSNFGPKVDTAAPGVGILSTVPERHGLTEPYAAMSGTSMASPAACGALAAILAGDEAYRDLPRDQTRAEAARTLLHQTCRTIGLERIYEGYGVLTVP
jgi:subtilisin